MSKLESVRVLEPEHDVIAVQFNFDTGEMEIRIPRGATFNDVLRRLHEADALYRTPEELLEGPKKRMAELEAQVKVLGEELAKATAPPVAVLTNAEELGLKAGAPNPEIEVGEPPMGTATAPDPGPAAPYTAKAGAEVINEVVEDALLDKGISVTVEKAAGESPAAPATAFHVEPAPLGAPGGVEGDGLIVHNDETGMFGMASPDALPTGKKE